MEGRRTLAGIAVCASLAWAAAPAAAQERYMGEIMLVGFNFCPRGTVEAAGQVLRIAENTSLFSLYGTMYGGDGRTTFGLPDLRGRSPVGDGHGSELRSMRVGEEGGAEFVTLTLSQMPPHSHTGHVRATTSPGAHEDPTGATPATAPVYSTDPPDTNIANTVETDSAGGGQPFYNRDPYLVMRYCVVMQGIMPSRD